MYKSVIITVSAFAGLAFAQIPTCAQACVVLPESCTTPDPSCICNADGWINDVACCVFANCDEADRQAALDYGNSICNPVGASLPTTTSDCPASATSASGSSAAAASTASTSATDASASASASSASVSSALSSALESVSTTASGGATTSSALATRMAAADGVTFAGALLGLAALL